jgi:hypothetical protein
MVICFNFVLLVVYHVIKRLNDLIAIENDHLKMQSVQYEDLINEFASKTTKKKGFFLKNKNK